MPSNDIYKADYVLPLAKNLEKKSSDSNSNFNFVAIVQKNIFQFTT